MNSVRVGQIILLAGGTIATYLWLLDKLAPSKSAVRRLAEYGLRQEYPCAEEPTQSKPSTEETVTTDVVFVHGLGADPSRTWHHGDVCWITDLLPEDLKKKTLQSSVRLFTFNYDSFWVRDSNSIRLTVTAESLGQQLSSDKLRERDIVLVGHSYGGIVIKQALVDMPELKIRVKGILFLGTPHRGTPFTRFGIFAASILTPLDADVHIMRPLVSDSVDLDDLEKRFSKHFHSTKRLYYFERHKMRRHLLGFIPWLREFVVPEQSATFGADASQRIALDTDHRGMNKFEDRNGNYSLVAGKLLNILLENSCAPPAGLRDQGRHWMVPFERMQDFVGRESVLQELMERVPPHTDKYNCQRTAIIGLGGVGKTRIALEVAYRIHKADPECSVFWVPAVDRTTFEQAYRGIGQKLQLDGATDDKTDIISLVKAALSYEDSGRWLLVVDNADDPELMFGKKQADHSVTGPFLARCLPSSPKGSVLFTTQNYQVAVGLGAQKLDVMSMETVEAQKLLENNLYSQLIGDAESTMRLLDKLANLPLAIRQASAYMKNNGTMTTKYLEIYESDNEEMIYLLSREFEDLGRYDNIKNPIAMTWLISFRQILGTNPLAADYLRFMSFLTAQDIPQSLLPPEGRARTIEAIGTLKAYRFITERENSGSYDIHRLVQVSAQCWLKEREEWGVWATKALQWLALAFPSPKYENRDVWIRYLPHTQYILECQKDTNDDEAKRNLLLNVGKSFYIMGRYREAEQMYRQSLELREKVLGKEHPDTLESMNNLGVAFYSMEKNEEAEKMHRQTLELRENVLGKEHPDTLESMNNLGLVLHSMRKYEEAEQMYRQSLELREKVLGKEHPDTLTSMNNLGVAFYSMEKNEEAEKMHRQTLELREKVLGKEHPDTLTSLNSLGVVFNIVGKYEEAEPMYRQTLELREKVLGKEHPDTLKSMNNLGVMFYNLEKYEEAEKMHRQTLELREKVLGKEHPYTLKSMNNLGVMFYNLEKYKEAEKMHRQSLELREKVLGKEHPDTLESMNNLELVLKRLGESNKL